MKTTIIKSEDVTQVANSVGLRLSPAEINEVIEKYPNEQRQDLTGRWDLVVEHICHSIVADRED